MKNEIFPGLKEIQGIEVFCEWASQVFWFPTVLPMNYMDCICKEDTMRNNQNKVWKFTLVHSSLLQPVAMELWQLRWKILVWSILLSNCNKSLVESCSHSHCQICFALFCAVFLSILNSKSSSRVPILGLEKLCFLFCLGSRLRRRITSMNRIASALVPLAESSAASNVMAQRLPSRSESKMRWENTRKL